MSFVSLVLIVGNESGVSVVLFSRDYWCPELIALVKTKTAYIHQLHSSGYRWSFLCQFLTLLLLQVCSGTPTLWDKMKGILPGRCPRVDELQNPQLAQSFNFTKFEGMW